MTSKRPAVAGICNQNRCIGKVILSNGIMLINRKTDPPFSSSSSLQILMASQT
jgi:hypothetical protein